jgi:ATPase family AAA domain-containing protein 2
LIPSTARATSSASAPLPEKIKPLLGGPFEKVKDVLKKVLPEVKKVNVLEEAEYEEEESTVGGFEREKLRQSKLSMLELNDNVEMKRFLIFRFRVFENL